MTRRLTWTVILAVTSAARAQIPGSCDQPGEAPDVVVTSLHETASYGSVGGISAFALGTRVCNRGDCRLRWFAENANHPVIGQNLFRLKDGRFEQIGQSWVKHTVTAENYPCDGCLGGDVSHLNVGCGDTYTALMNGGQIWLGPKSEVNPHTGMFPFPAGDYVGSGAITARLQVHNVDLDPAMQVGALYFGEVQLVAADDAAGHNGDNNVTWRQILVSGSGASFTIARTGPDHSTETAVHAWKFFDPSVELAIVPVIGDGALHVAAKATDLGGGTWHYEYAVQNVDSHRAAVSFRVPLPSGATITNVGFHDVDYHSGEPFAETDWSPLTGPDGVMWATESHATNPNGNALRWGTLYNFRFDANVPPARYPVEIGLFRPGSPSSVTVRIVAPDLCDHDGICDSLEDPCQCLSDCPAAPAESCGNDVDDDCDGLIDCADPGCVTQGTPEISCSNRFDDDCDGSTDCADSDCIGLVSAEGTCDDAFDNDCDGLFDCVDDDCCGHASCSAALDADADLHPIGCDCNEDNPAVHPGAPQICDGINDDCSDPAWPSVPAGEQDGDADAHPACADCDDSNVGVWATPGEVATLFLFAGTEQTTLLWSQAPGGTVAAHDAVRSSTPATFTSATCLPIPNPSNNMAVESAVPMSGASFFYLVRARNACPSGGIGAWGAGTNGVPREGPICP